MPSASSSIWPSKSAGLEGNAARFLSGPGQCRLRPRSRRHRRQAVSADTEPFFVVSSGRSRHGHAAQGACAAAGVSRCITNTWCRSPSRLAVSRYLGAGQARARRRAILRETHGAAVRYSEAAHWGDSSNKLSWLIPELAALLPRGALRSSGARRAQSGELLFPQAGRRNVTTTARRPSCRPFRRSRASSRAAAGKKILVAAAAARRADRGCIPRLRPVRAHLLALGGDQPRGAGSSVGSRPSRSEHVRAAGRSARIAVRKCGRFIEFLNLPYRDREFRRVCPAPQRQPPGRPSARCRAARPIRAIAGAMMARLGYAGQPGICSELLTSNRMRIMVTGFLPGQFPCTPICLLRFLRP